MKGWTKWINFTFSKQKIKIYFKNKKRIKLFIVKTSKHIIAPLIFESSIQCKILKFIMCTFWHCSLSSSVLPVHIHQKIYKPLLQKKHQQCSTMNILTCIISPISSFFLFLSLKSVGLVDGERWWASKILWLVHAVSFWSHKLTLQQCSNTLLHQPMSNNFNGFFGQWLCMLLGLLKIFTIVFSDCLSEILSWLHPIPPFIHFYGNDAIKKTCTTRTQSTKHAHTHLTRCDSEQALHYHHSQ